MSKKNKAASSSAAPMALAGHEGEHQVIKHDLIRILVMNAIFLAALLALYYANLHRNFLDNWLTKYINI